MRYIIGIDLGTTNSSVSYIDTLHPHLSLQPFLIPQISSGLNLETSATLPSFCYLLNAEGGEREVFKLPWKQSLDIVVGQYALSQGAKIPTRLIQSAKSWLCHSAANRREKILPFEADASSRHLSPVEASSQYLLHIKEAWNHMMARNKPESEFEEQEIILTVPASFDEVSRLLTIEAAKAAGFKTMTLLEEPQAAFYSWISQNENAWTGLFNPGTRILVCDVGGGTTDFSLIEVVRSTMDSPLSFRRIAVGDHLLLGGDNMDATVAHFLEGKLPELSSMQQMQLKHEARQAKEFLMNHPEAKSCRVVLQGTGSNVVKGSLVVEISSQELQSLLLEGFFGAYPWEEAVRLRKGSGIRSMGLPYEDEPSITKHLAHFLKQCGGLKPDFVLFNGGAMKPKIFQERIVDSLRNWFPETRLSILESISLDQAVARGAAYFGKARRGLGVKIGGGISRGYYLAVQEGESVKVVNLLPKGTEEGISYESERTFQVVPNTPVAFQIYTSHTRLNDRQGDVISLDTESMHALPPLLTVLKFGKKASSVNHQEKIPTHLFVKFTELGTLELWIKSQISEHQWSLEFQLRNASGQENSLTSLESKRVEETFDSQLLEKAKQHIREAFRPGLHFKVERLNEQLEMILDQSRLNWSPSVLRGLFEPLLQVASQRKLIKGREERWWNLAGFLLRPGFGYPLDDFRMRELWKIILSDLKSKSSVEVKIQQWICFRRIAGGLSKGHQAHLVNDILPQLTNGEIVIKNKADGYHYFEKIRTFAALELLDVPLKVKYGQAIVKRIKKGIADKADFWSLGRIGARHLVYGSAANIIPSAECEKWIREITDSDLLSKDSLLFTLSQLARKTDVRELNVSDKLRSELIVKFPELEERLTRTSHLTLVEQELVFGDKLPLGLSLE